MSVKIHKIDAKRLLCPLPVIRLGEAINRAEVGDRIEVVATNPGVLFDIPAWCKVHGHRVISSSENDDEIVLLVEILAAT